MERPSIPNWVWMACGAAGGGVAVWLFLKSSGKRGHPQSSLAEAAAAHQQEHQHPGTKATGDTPGVVASIGNTKLIELKSLSRALGCRIMVAHRLIHTVIVCVSVCVCVCVCVCVWTTWGRGFVFENWGNTPIVFA